MTLLEENDFVNIFRHDDIKAYELRFKKASSDLFGKGFINQMEVFGSIIINQTNQGYKCPNIIINMVEDGPTMEPEVQAWMHKEFFPLLKENYITTKAYCLGEQILPKLSVEITVEEDPNALFNVNFFTDLESGKEWLRSQNS